MTPLTGFQIDIEMVRLPREKEEKERGIDRNNQRQRGFIETTTEAADREAVLRKDLGGFDTGKQVSHFLHV